MAAEVGATLKAFPRAFMPVTWQITLKMLNLNINFVLQIYYIYHFFVTFT